MWKFFNHFLCKTFNILNFYTKVSLNKSYLGSVWVLSCTTLCNLLDCNPPGSSVHGISQARILEWVAISFSRRSSQPGNWTWVSCIVGRGFTVWATREVLWRRHAIIYQTGIDRDTATDTDELHWWLSDTEPACNAGDLGSLPGLRRFPWRRKWQPAPVFLPGKSHGQRSLVSCNAWGRKRVGHHQETKQQHGYRYRHTIHTEL